MKTANSVVLDYSVDVIQLDDADFILDYGELGNFSVAGFEMKLRRHVSHYLITYYLPSGKLSLLRKQAENGLQSRSSENCKTAVWHYGLKLQ